MVQGCRAQAAKGKKRLVISFWPFRMLLFPGKCRSKGKIRSVFPFCYCDRSGLMCRSHFFLGKTPNKFCKSVLSPYICNPIREMVLWPSGQAQVCKTCYSGSIPLGTSQNLSRCVLLRFFLFVGSKCSHIVPTFQRAWITVPTVGLTLEKPLEL